MKTKRNTQELIDILNRELTAFSQRKSIMFYPVENTMHDYTEGSLHFNGFEVLFRCHKEMTGYSFMEPPVYDTNPYSVFGGTAAKYEMLFRFPFSPITFSAYDIHNVIEDTVFETLLFNNISDEKSAVYAVNKMLGFLERNYFKIECIAEENTLQKKITENYIFDHEVLCDGFDETQFYEDLTESVKLHECLLFLHAQITDELYSFILRGNPRRLIKRLEKSQRKGRLTTFELRFKKHMEERNYEKISENISAPIIERNKINFSTGVIYTASMMLSFIGAVIAIEILQSLWSSVFIDGLYILTLNVFEICSVLLIIAFTALIFVAIKKLRFTKNKIQHKIIKDKYDKPVLIISSVLIVFCILFSMYGVRNKSIYVDNNTLYYCKEPAKNNEVTFILIQGYEYEEGGRTVYSTDTKELLCVIDGDYEDFTYCNANDGDVDLLTSETLAKLKQAGAKTESYKTIEAFGEKHGIYIEG